MHVAWPVLHPLTLHGRAVRGGHTRRLRPTGGLPLLPGNLTLSSKFPAPTPPIQLILRPYYDLRYRLFSNVVLLAHRNARALVHHVAKSHTINIVAVGAPSPHEFLHTLVEILEIVVANRLRRELCVTRKLCPRCVQGAGMYSTMEEDGRTCSSGHLLTPQELREGALWEKRSWCRNSIWTSKVRAE